MALELTQVKEVNMQTLTQTRGKQHAMRKPFTLGPPPSGYITSKAVAFICSSCGESQSEGALLLSGQPCCGVGVLRSDCMGVAGNWGCPREAVYQQALYFT